MENKLKIANDKHKTRYIFFWGNHSNKPYIIKACLSQWWECAFNINGVTYNTAEQYMMAQKALLFGDKETFNEIMTACTPNEFKALGRKVKNFSQDIWDANKESIVYEGNYAKFSQNNELRQYLLETGNLILVEASPYDTIWGIGMSQDDPNILDESKWRGLNLLGKTLMKVRMSLAEEKFK